MKIRLLTLLLLLLAVLPGRAATLAAPDIRELIILGLANNIGLQVERFNIPLSAEEIRVATAAFDSELFAATGYAESSTPQALAGLSADRFSTEQLTGQLGLRKMSTSGLSSEVSLRSERSADNNQLEGLQPRYKTALLLNLSQPLWRNFGSEVNTTTLQVARIQNQQSSYAYFLQAQALALQIETLALQFVRDAEVVKLRTQALQLAQELHAANKRRLDAGVIPVSEVQEAETDLADRQLQLSLALQAQQLGLQQLNRQLNFALPADFSAAAVYPANLYETTRLDYNLPAFDELFALAKEQRLDLKIGHLDLASSALQKKYYHNQQQPQLDLQLQGGLHGLAGNPRNGTIASDYTGSWNNSFSSLSAADGYQWRAGLEFSLPIGNQAAEARFRQAVLRERQAAYRQRDLEAALKQELLQQQTVLQRAAEQVRIAEQFQQLAEKSLQQEQRRLEEGLSDTFRMLLFQNKMISAKIERIAALTYYRLAVANLNYARGIILQQHGITVASAAEEENLETL